MLIVRCDECRVYYLFIYLFILLYLLETYFALNVEHCNNVNHIDVRVVFRFGFYLYGSGLKK